MSKKRKSAASVSDMRRLTDLEIEVDLADLVEDGDLEFAGKNEKGEQLFKLTDKGRASTEKMLRDCGVDPNEKEAVLRFIRGEVAP